MHSRRKTKCQLHEQNCNITFMCLMSHVQLQCDTYASDVTCGMDTGILKSLWDPLPSAPLEFLCSGQQCHAQPFQTVWHLIDRMLLHFLHSNCKLCKGFPTESSWQTWLTAACAHATWFSREPTNLQNGPLQGAQKPLGYNFSCPSKHHEKRWKRSVLRALITHRLIMYKRKGKISKNKELFHSGS